MTSGNHTTIDVSQFTINITSHLSHITGDRCDCSTRQAFQVRLRRLSDAHCHTPCFVWFSVASHCSVSFLQCAALCPSVTTIEPLPSRLRLSPTSLSARVRRASCLSFLPLFVRPSFTFLPRLASMASCTSCKKRTTSFCFKHKLAVCDDCIAHPLHVELVPCLPCDPYGNYFDWLTSGEYEWPQRCGVCNRSVGTGEGDEAKRAVVRLVCKCLYHRGCLYEELSKKKHGDASLQDDRVSA